MVDDPGWEAADDGCKVRSFRAPDALWPCELDAGHVERGEPHTYTVTWFDEVAEPDCDACADTGQVNGEPCPQWCDRAYQLAGLEKLPEAQLATMDHETTTTQIRMDVWPAGWSGVDDP